MTVIGPVGVGVLVEDETEEAEGVLIGTAWYALSRLPPPQYS